MSDALYRTWASDSEKNSVYDVNDLDGYDGAVYRSSAHSTPYRKQTYIDIEPNRSVRPSFNRSDYDAFRPGEAIPTKQKRIMAMCMSAYDRVGIINCAPLLFYGLGVLKTIPSSALYFWW